MIEAISLGFEWEGSTLERPFGKDRICGVIAAGTASAMIVAIQRGLKSTRTLELRLDYLRNARERTAVLRWLERQRPRATLIATCRSRQGGGCFEAAAKRSSKFWRKRRAQAVAGVTSKLKPQEMRRRRTSEAHSLPRA